MIHSNSNKPSIVLVHGAFADGSGWKKVISILEVLNRLQFKTVATQVMSSR